MNEKKPNKLGFKATPRLSYAPKRYPNSKATCEGKRARDEAN